IWSDLGLYPTTPGAPFYATGSPLFERATIRTGGAPITISAACASLATKYVTSLMVNRASVSHPWVRQAALVHGSTISFEMSSVPNVTWGSARIDAPPSMSTASSLADFGCAG